MKALVFAALLLGAAAGHADTYFSCTGLIADGNEVTVEGSFTDAYKMTDHLTVTQTVQYGPSASYKSPAEQPHYFSKSDVHIMPTNDYWSLAATYKSAVVMIRHKDGSVGQTYMRVYLNPNFDHEFAKAKCEFSRY